MCIRDRLQLLNEQAQIEEVIARSMALEDESEHVGSNEQYQLEEALKRSQLDYERQIEIQNQELEQIRMIEELSLKEAEEARRSQIAQQEKAQVEVHQNQDQQENKEEEKESQEHSYQQHRKNVKLEPLVRKSTLPPLQVQSKYEKPVTELLKDKDELQKRIQNIKFNQTTDLSLIHI
eukprot:TRINITY_DN2961_c0_g1_i18.p2 TRINITY_DN2961_c0_g1~~TRINITY_DN2961_c0_g1_i18.p2  ORF type:complete len:178 (+),score=37.46 TRINITY_DN2961_c0_g1_i18:66-599(+)